MFLKINYYAQDINHHLEAPALGQYAVHLLNHIKIDGSFPLKVAIYVQLHSNAH